MTTEELWEPVREDGQARLDAAGLAHVRLVFGHFRIGDKVRFEARLKGGSPPDQLKARKLLPFTDEK